MTIRHSVPSKLSKIHLHQALGSNQRPIDDYFSTLPIELSWRAYFFNSNEAN